MKKLLVLAALVVQVFAVRAAQSGGDSSWLYWTLDLQDEWGNEVVWWEKPVGVADGTYDVWLVAENKTTSEKFTYHTDEQITLSNNGTQGSIGGASVAELKIDDLTAYSFYSAIVEEGEGLSNPLWTSHVQKYESISGFIQTGTMTSADIWNTAVVPEPTSGLLLLLGVAGLALKRKRA